MKDLETKRILERAAGREMHDACWWLPEVLEELCKLHGVDWKKPKLPPEQEFRAGCNHYARELYMSRESIFVECVDGLYYQNPVLFGDDWYLCFNEPEVVVKKFPTTTVASARKRAATVLRKAGIKFILGIDLVKSRRVFPPKWDKFSDAISFSGNLAAPIPVPQQFDTQVTSLSADCAFCAWGMQFDVEDVANAFRPNGRISPRLAAFVLCQDSYTADIEQLRRQLIKMVGKNAADVEALRQEHGDRITLRRQ